MLLLPALTTLTLAIGAASSPAPPMMDAPLAAYQTGGLPYLAHVQSLIPDDEAFAALSEEEDDNPMGPAAGTEQLDAMRGGDGTTSSIIMNGTVTDNRATNVVTGANTITAGAFANASGVPMVVQNTGANVLIQNATVINLRLQ